MMDQYPLHIVGTALRQLPHFLEFVLSHYVSVGVEELDQENLTPLLRLRYHNSIADALADLGRAEEIGQVFAGFQKYLYQQQDVAWLCPMTQRYTSASDLCSDIASATGEPVKVIDLALWRFMADVRPPLHG